MHTCETANFWGIRCRGWGIECQLKTIHFVSEGYFLYYDVFRSQELIRFKNLNPGFRFLGLDLKILFQSGRMV